MKTIISNQIGMIIGCIILLMWFEPIQIIGSFLIVNIGYWCRYFSEKIK